jgi:hypothetical protein
LDAAHVDTGRGRDGRTIVYYEDVEGGCHGWTKEGFGGELLWHPTSLAYVSPTHSWWCGIEEQQNYDTGARVQNAVMSPYINLAAYTPPHTLEFFEWYQTESGYDFCMVDVTPDSGATWIPLRGEYGSAPSGYSGGWISSQYDLSPYGDATVSVRYYFDTGDEIGNDYPGWFVDDISVLAAGLAWLSVEPTGGTVAAGDTIEITVTFDATYLDPGSYDGVLAISSNDPVTPHIEIPVRLTVLEGDENVTQLSQPEVGARDLPVVFALHPSWPNPSRHGTTISFDVPRPERVRLKIYDLQGRVVRVLVDGLVQPGRHVMRWDARDNGGRPQGAGVYFSRMVAGDFVACRRMVLVQ